MIYVSRKPIHLFIAAALAHSGRILAHDADSMAHESDDPLLARIMVDQLEWRDADDGSRQVLEAQGWIGKDLDKLWLKSDIQRTNGTTDELEVQALYSRAIAPFWDLQAGLRQDFKPDPDRTWGTIGVHGLAPYYFEVDAALFVAGSGDTAARFKVEYEWLFTQRLILAPEISADFHGQNDRRRQSGSGLSDVQAGLRLRYEIRREFAPYVGVNWQKSFGNTADFLREQDEPVHDTEWVVGVRAWF